MTRRTRATWFRAAAASAVAVATLGRAGPLYAAPADDALEELKRGYALKQQGDCRAALPHFERSVDLAATPKALLNLSDCEARLGDLAAAREHASRGKQLAEQGADAELAGVARDQLVAIDRRVAWLTVRLAQSAPPDSAVRRDGAPLDASMLGVPIPLNPGAHSISVVAPGREARDIDVVLVEGQHADVDAAPGAERTSASAWVPAAAALGVGALGLGLGVGAGLPAVARHNTLQQLCTGGVCPESERGDLDAFRSLRTWSTIGYVVAAAGVAGAAVLWFAVPGMGAHASAHAWVGPGGVGIAGSY